MDKTIYQWPWWIQEELLKRLMIKDWSYLNDLSVGKKKYFNKIIEKYHQGIPLTKIIGIKYFYDYKLINHNTLDPRYDSEVIFDIFDYWNSINYRPSTAIELGGGSGCLTISMIKRFNNTMTIGELNDETIKTLKRNLKINNVHGDVIKSNWWSNIQGSWNVLIANPPYLSIGEMINGDKWATYGDPDMALYGGLDGLDDYRSILKEADKFITQWIILEICSDKLNNIINLINKPWSLDKIFYDLQQRPRMLLCKKNLITTKD